MLEYLQLLLYTVILLINVQGALNFMNPKSGIWKIKVRQKIWWSGVFAFFSRGVTKEGALFECMGDVAVLQIRV